MSNVKSLHKYLVSPVTSCFTCPLAFLKSVELFSGEKEYGCTADKERSLGKERSTNGAPDWCSLKRQPVLVIWKGEQE